jgi:hypothetical protein
VFAEPGPADKMSFRDGRDSLRGCGQCCLVDLKIHGSLPWKVVGFIIFQWYGNCHAATEVIARLLLPRKS